MSDEIVTIAGHDIKMSDYLLYCGLRYIGVYRGFIPELLWDQDDQFYYGRFGNGKYHVDFMARTIPEFAETFRSKVDDFMIARKVISGAEEDPVYPDEVFHLMRELFDIDKEGIKDVSNHT